MVVNNFDKLKSDETQWYSRPFNTHVGGYKMCLCIYANGNGSGEGTHISVFVYMMRGDFDSHLQWPFKGKITVQLVNQKEGGEHYEMNPVTMTSQTADGYNDVFHRCVDCDISDEGWGLQEFVSHADLYKPEEGKEYLKNDTLKFRVTKVDVTSV